MKTTMATDTIQKLNEIFLQHFPGKKKGEGDIITYGESRFHNQPQVMTPEFNYYKAKFMLGYPDDLENCGISDRLDKLLWEHYDIFHHITMPRLKANADYTVIFPLLDLFDMAWNERNPSLTIRALTSKTELNRDCVGWLASGVMDVIDKRFKYWEVDMGNWWSDTIETRKRLKEMSNPRNGTDYNHLDGYYAFNIMERIDWEEGTTLTDKSIFIYRFLCVLNLADNQDLLLLDAEPTNGILRKTLSEFVRNRIKSYQNWENKRTKRL